MTANSTKPDRSAAILHTDNQTVFLITTMAARRGDAPKFECAFEKLSRRKVYGGGSKSAEGSEQRLREKSGWERR
jgi:hypothetical protein